MRTIEKQIVNYLRNSDFSSDSTIFGKEKHLSTRDCVEITNTQKSVFLWDSCIFTLDKEGNIRFSFCGYPTNTTKGRINALLLAFSSCSAVTYHKNYTLFFSSSEGVFPIDSDKIYTVKNGKPEEVESI